MRRILLLALPVLLATVLVPTFTVQAAAAFVKAQPAAGTTLDQPPAEVRVEFNESLTSESALTVVDEKGFVVSDESRLDGGQSENAVLVAPLNDLAPGRYTVSWFTVSAGDLSLAEGEYSFTVRGAAAASPQPSATAPTKAPATAAPTAAPTKAAPAPTAAPTPKAAGAQVTEAAPTAAQQSAAARPEAVPQSASLPNTAGGAPAPWMFGAGTALAALAVWGVRRKL